MPTRRRALAAFAVCSFLAGWVGLPSRAAAQAIPAEQLKKIKAATVYVRVIAGQVGGTGSGFLVRTDPTTGYVVTNDHVVTLGWKVGGPRQTKPTVTVVFNSGNPDEWTAPGEVVAGDPERDLAVIRVRVKKPLPEPLALTGPTRVAETTQVFICGFPFGDKLSAGDKHPEISINQASVSSNRTDDRGILTEVQLSGSLNPGNSGGPVVTADGKLVGVAVTTIRGAGIGNAVPHAMVSEMLKGRVTDPAFVIPQELAGSRQAILLVKMVDPMAKIKTARAVIAPARPGKEAKPSNDVVKLPGAIPVRITGLPDDRAYGIAQVTFPANATHIWAQSEWTETDGTVRRGPASKLQIAELAGDNANPNVPPGFTPPGNVPTTPPAGPSPFDSPWDGGTTPPAGGGSGFVTPGPATPPPAVPSLPGQFATSLPPMLPGQVTLTALNLNPPTYLDRPVTVDVMTSGADLKGNGDGPSLIAYLPTGGQTGRLDFVLDPATAEAVNAVGLLPPGGRRVAARVRGTVKEAPSKKQWKLVVVDEVSLLGPAGTPVATFSRGGASGGPAGGSADWDRTLTALAQTGGQAVGREFELRVVVAGVLSETVGVGPRTRSVSRLQFTNTSRQPVAGLKFFLSEGLADQLRTAQQRAGGGPLNAAVTVRVTEYDRGTQEVVGQVNGVRMYDPQWQAVVWSGTATDARPVSPPAGPTAEFTPPPSATSPPPAAAKETSGGGMSTLLIVIVAVAMLVLVLGGVGLGWFLLTRSGKKPAKGRRRYDEDDEDDEEEDEDDRPRRRRR